MSSKAQDGALDRLLRALTETFLHGQEISERHLAELVDLGASTSRHFELVPAACGRKRPGSGAQAGPCDPP